MIDSIVQFICEYEGMEPDEVKPGMNLRTDLGLTSLELFDIFNAKERRFAVKNVSNDEIAKNETIQDIADFIEQKTAQ